MANLMESDLVHRVTGSPLLRVLLLGFLVLLLLIPTRMVMAIIQERGHTRDEAVREITSKWGDSQILAGPRIQVPYLVPHVETEPDGTEKVRKETNFAHFLPEKLEVRAALAAEERYRGIFEVPVYGMTAEFTGTFERPDFSGWDVAPEDILWERATLTVSVSDVRGIDGGAVLSWNGSPLHFEPGLGESSSGGGGIHVPLDLKAVTGEASFAFSLSLKGSRSAFFTALGKATRVKIEGNWAAPSFNGNWLPSERELGAEGFSAAWETSYLGRNFPQRWHGGGGWDEAVAESKVGVDLITPVDEYRMALRSVVYAPLFFVLTFVTLWLFEVLVGFRVHPVQYLLVGSAMCLFYLLELSLAEHIGFALAYTVATLAVIGAVAPYCYSVLASLHRASVMGIVLATLYGYLFVVLKNQDYALLAGSLGLFAALATVMYLTRNVDWNAGRMPRGDGRGD
ncbi:MAG: Inner membrane protein CreD [bacterium]|nr:Inner membrane protein CreD [bacterium]